MAATRQNIAITALGVVNVILGGMLVLSSGSLVVLLAILEGAAAQEIKPKDVPGTSFKEMMEQSGIAWGVLVGALLVAGGALIVSGYGLVTRRRWGRALALFLLALVVILTIAGLLSGRLQLDPCIFVGIAAYFLFCCIVLLRGQNAAEFE